MEDCVIKTIDSFDINFWIDLNKDYLNCLAVKMFPLKNYLQIYYRFSNEEILEFATKIEIEVYENLKKEITKRCKDISTLAIELFRKKFCYEKENIQRNWNRLEDEQIDSLFKRCKSELTEIFDTFKIFRIVKNSLYCK
jgi:hypothetical protein